jgi:hypothetical protein
MIQYFPADILGSNRGHQNKFDATVIKVTNFILKTYFNNSLHGVRYTFFLVFTFLGLAKLVISNLFL